MIHIYNLNNSYFSIITSCADLQLIMSGYHASFYLTDLANVPFQTILPITVSIHVIIHF